MFKLRLTILVANFFQAQACAVGNMCVCEQGGDDAGNKQRQRARAAHAQLRDPSGDALSAVAALCAFQLSACPANFCRLDLRPAVSVS